MQKEIEEWYLSYYGQLRLFVRRICPDETACEDIVQSTFLEAIKSLESFRKNSSAKTWLFSIAKHQAYRYLQKNPLVCTQAEFSESGYENDYESGLLAEKILEEIENLEPPIREILKYRLLYGMAFAEIGQRLGLTENYCRVNFFRARERLKKRHRQERDGSLSSGKE